MKWPLQRNTSIKVLTTFLALCMFLLNNVKILENLNYFGVWLKSYFLVFRHALILAKIKYYSKHHFRPVKEVLLPRKYGILCLHQRSITDAITDRPTHNALVDFFTDSFYLQHTVQILLCSILVHHVQVSITGCWIWALCAVERFDELHCTEKTRSPVLAEILFKTHSCEIWPGNKKRKKMNFNWGNYKLNIWLVITIKTRSVRKVRSPWVGAFLSHSSPMSQTLLVSFYF